MESVKDRIKALAESSGKTIAAVEKDLGIGNGTIGRWDTSAPSADKLSAVADYFDVSVDYLLGREPSDEVEEMLEYLHKNPEMRVLLSSSAKLEKGDLDAVVEIVKRMHKERDND